ncbi:MAG TPA: alpha-amylase family glycosyl hydrolase [Gaiellaceae bacterium]|nr:alpha-amylase family glycosyl hydrolase [Gaiellaceae bacterium]
MRLVDDPSLRRPFGAVPVEDGLVAFRVWAPAASTVAVRLDGVDHPLEPAGDGVHEGRVAARPGADYRYVLDGGEPLADPWSRFQPEGVLGPSRVLDTGGFVWSDGAWEGLALDELVLYELHVGTFTEEGTFEAAIPHLAELAELGVTAIELMPVATFPGDRGWGYDGVYASAPHPAYGGPEGLVRLVDAAHAAGLGVILDVVYNHLGPGGDAFSQFGPFFTDAHHTFWGDAIDYAQPAVREWAIQNACSWVRDYHVDGLRLDATHAVFDDGPRHVLAELADRVHGESPRALVISEMETGDLRPIEEWGHDAQWADEFHHEQHVLLTGEREGYYADYRGSVAALARQLLRRPAERLVFCTQNHDQVGNRAFGDRPPRSVQPLQALVLLFAPQAPLLFMGQEHADPAPFRFFTDHVDSFVADAVREGRRAEFAAFSAFAGEDVPDPQREETFLASKLSWTGEPELRRLVQQLLLLRRSLPRECEVGWSEEERWLTVRRGPVELVANFAEHAVDVGGTTVPPLSGVLR